MNFFKRKKSICDVGRKSVLIGFLMLLLLEAGGYFLLLKFQQFEQYEKQQEAIRARQGDFTDMTISLQEYESWKDSDREINIHGRMYDISEMKVHNGMVYLKLLKDDWETEIISMLHFIEGGNQSDKRTHAINGQLLLMMLSPAIQNEYESLVYIFCSGSEALKYPSFYTFPYNIHLEITSPPPDFFI